MHALIQRVKEASVEIAGQPVSRIQQGLLTLIGFLPTDDRPALEKILKKVLHLRVFPDEKKSMNVSLSDIGGGLLIVPQFTLVADLSRGLRPSFSAAAPPDKAMKLFDTFAEMADSRHSPVAFGRFGADMQVHLINDGPVTFWLDSNQC